ncbi:glycoside hydrolase family protein [Massilia aquatica]|uniref:Lysozyme n=1 Tax=Massilia aquatica TaxID=2609000 RepID=A0ABX0M4C6_9BURK|nr:lysozyme [Massilia aquatica]
MSCVACGNCTWGIGIKAHDGPCTAAELKQKVSAAQVEVAFSSKVAEAERGVRRRVTKQALSEIQFDALVSLAYNLGIPGSSDIFDLVGSGNLKAAGRLIASMTKARVKGRDGKTKFVLLRGLIIRRAGEAAPFLSSEK